jgi:glucose/mannose-6-phosphate isomerase
MLEYSDLEKYDPSGMHKVYDRWPQITKEAYESNLEPVDFNDIDHIVFSGMGGSGAIGDLFSAVLSKTNVHVNVIKGYLLPKTVDSRTLVVATSICGDTVETLTVLDSAKKCGCKLIAFSDSGKMQKYCSKNGIEHKQIPMLHSPRASFTSFLYSMLKVLGPVLPIRKEDVVESITQLKKLQNEVTSGNLTDNNPSLSLAQWISGIPLIYYPLGLQAAAIRFKNSLQENAKCHVIAEDVVEACHNGIVAWEKPSDIKPILIRGEDDYIKTKERWEILKEYLEGYKIEYKEVFSVKGSILSKLICLIYLLDYSSIYFATLSGIDPTPINAIDFVKSKLV